MKTTGHAVMGKSISQQTANDSLLELSLHAIGDDIAKLDDHLSELRNAQGSFTLEQQNALDALTTTAAVLLEMSAALYVYAPPVAP